MVDMTVTEYHRADLFGCKREGLAVFFHFFSAALDQTAIKQDGLTIGSQDVTRARYPAGRAVEFNVHKDRPWDCAGHATRARLWFISIVYPVSPVKIEVQRVFTVQVDCISDQLLSPVDVTMC